MHTTKPCSRPNHDLDRSRPVNASMPTENSFLAGKAMYEFRRSPFSVDATIKPTITDSAARECSRVGSSNNSGEGHTHSLTRPRWGWDKTIQRKHQTTAASIKT